MTLFSIYKSTTISNFSDFEICVPYELKLLLENTESMFSDIRDVKKRAMRYYYYGIVYGNKKSWYSW